MPKFPALFYKTLSIFRSRAPLGLVRDLNRHNDSARQSLSALANTQKNDPQNTLNELLEAKIRLRAAYDLSFDALTMSDDSGFVDCNTAALALFGCASIEEFCRYFPSDLSPATQACGTDSKTLSQHYIDLTLKQGSCRFQWLHQRANNGIVFETEVLLSSLEIDGKTIIQGVHCDLTARKKLASTLAHRKKKNKALKNALYEQKLLQELNSRTSKIFEHTPGMVFEFCLTADGHTRLPFASLGIESIYELTAEQVKDDAAAVFARIHPDDLAQVSASIQESARSMQALHLEYRVNLPQKGLRWLLNLASPEKQDDGSIIWYGLNSDITARKQLEAALIQANILQEATFNSAIFSSIATDAQGVIQIFNKGAQNMLGYSGAEIINKMTPAYFSDHQELTLRAKTLSMVYGVPITPGFETMVYKASREIHDIYELTYIHKDGHPIPALVSITALRDATETIIGYLLIATDHTEQKAAKLQLKTLSLAIEQSNSVVMITDLNANIEYVNQAFINSSGYPREDIIGQSASLLKSGKTPQATIEAMWTALHDGTTWHGELINKNKWGEESIQRTWITPIRQDNQIISHYLSVTEDVTERKKTEATLIKLSMALEQSQSSVMITDLDSNIEYVNQAFVNSTGYSKEEIIGQKPTLFKTGKTTSATYDEMWTTLLAGNAWQGEVINVNKQGEEFIELTWISPIHQNDGSISHYLGVKEDITQRKKTEALLLAAKEKAEKLAKTKSQFLSNMSHEIRTPMNAIIGFSELALFDEMPTKTRTYLQDINSASNHLLTILNDILDLSKIEAACMSITLAPFQLNIIVLSIHNLLIKAAQTKCLSLTLNIAKNIPDKLIGDSVRLRQVLVNLLGNAIKFTQHGLVELNISLQQLTATEARLLFSVIDTGIGISALQQDKLFQPFSQVDDGFSRNFEGTGLGLTISQDLVQLMGGSIKLDSNVDLGSCFSFELTLALDLATIESPLTPAMTLNPEALSGIRILVAEDDAFNQKIITQVLEKFGASIVLANNGLEALAALEQERFDIVLMDLHMPSMNGYEATLAIRKQARYAQLPVITLSASVTDEEKQRCLATGMNDFIGKPINKIELLATLEQWLKR